MNKKHVLLKPKVIAVALALCSFSNQTLAIQSIQLNQYFMLNNLEANDIEGDENVKANIDTLSDFYIHSLSQASDYFTNVIGANNIKSTSLIPILIQTQKVADDNAFATSYIAINGPYTGLTTSLTQALMTNYFDYGNPDFENNVAVIGIDRGTYANTSSGWYEGPMHNLTYGGEDGYASDLTSTMIHELSHALGLASNSEKHSELYDSKNGIIGSFGTNSDQLGLFDQGLRDITGKAPLAGMEIKFEEKLNNEDNPDDYFLIRGYSDDRRYQVTANNGLYFTGTHVQEVLNGALISSPSDSTIKYEVPGIPVNGVEWSESNGSWILNPEFSHLELQNGQMSHQMYRNWNGLMEAELAVLQDTGLTLDRRKLFGYSVYNSGTESKRRYFENYNPYLNRTDDGQWIEGEANPYAYGIGLHVYGSYNDIVQKADLLSSGSYGIGIRVDGSSNHMIIPNGTRVSADGEGGIGLLVSYGKDHEVMVAGTVSALGKNGDAIRFDFGDNNLGNQAEYRGSYIRNVRNYENGEVAGTKQEDLLPELNGALVSDFILSGTIAGTGSAIRISKNAYVENIKIKSSAKIYGDIISEWDPAADFIQSNGELLTTNINFGEDNSNFNYQGNITGINGLVINFKGNGNTTIHGNNQVREVNIAQGANLTTGGSYVLWSPSSTSLSTYARNSSSYSRSGVFTNEGTLTTDSKLTIQGNYLASPNSQTIIGYTTDTIHSLTLNGSSNFESGSLVGVTPNKDYYANNYTKTFSFDDLVNIDGASSVSANWKVGNISLNSPTLKLTSSLDGNGNLVVVHNRSTNAYAQYGYDANTVSVGDALYTASSCADNSLAQVFASLDFSNVDGSNITQALTKLQPTAHGSIALGMLDHQQFLNNRMRLLMRNAENGEHAYADTYAMQLHRGHGLTEVGSGKNAGVIAGLDKKDDLNNVYGVYINANYRYLGMGNSSSAKDYSLYAGIKGMFPLSEDNDLKFFTDLRAGFDTINYDKNIVVIDHASKLSDDFVAFGGSVSLGISKDIKLSSGTICLNGFSDYALLRTSTIHEGNDSLSLNISSHIYDSLKLGLGVDFVGNKIQIDDSTAYSLNGSLSVRRELLDDLGSIKASFTHAPEASFRYKAQFQGKNSVSASFGGSYYSGNSIFSVNAGSEFFLGEGQEYFGQFNYTYKF